MLFNSLSFLVFFPTVFFLYWLLPKKLRTLLLLLVSCVFYMAFVPYYILILFYLIGLDYTLARLIDSAEGKRRRCYFLASILSTACTLIIFKYFNFFNGNITAFAKYIHWSYSISALSLILPLGLSFHTFQSLAYVIEVYKGNYKAEKNLLTYALYVMYFPQLVAGPIERPAQLLPQLKKTQTFDATRAFSGLRLMAWGFFKKIVIGDRLGVLVSFVFARSGTADASTLLIAVCAFSLQLYTDFSGYTDIALGASRTLGIELRENFHHPYFSRSMSEFWRRWHISLSSWFRDYLYIPLGGSRVSTLRWCINILIVFAVSGLWHGAGWHFIIMGLLFGTYICVGELTKLWRDRVATLLHIGTQLRSGIQILVSFILATSAWIFFRAQSAHQAFEVIYRIITAWGGSTFHFLRCSDYCSFYYIGLGRKDLLFLSISITTLFAVEFIAEKNISLSWWRYRVVRWSAYWILLLWILTVGYFVPQTFIYFQF